MKFYTCIASNSSTQKSFRLLLWVVLIFLTACNAATAQPTLSPTVALATATTTWPTPVEHKTSVPDAQSVTQAWLSAWAKDDYNNMYAMLTQVSRDALTSAKFIDRYSKVAISLTLQTLESEILQTLVLSPLSAQVAYRVNFKTAMLGEFTRDITMNLRLENGTWKVQWDDALIMPELRGGNRLSLDIKVPARGDIFDRAGLPIAARTEAVAIGLMPGNIEDAREKSMLNELAALTGKPSAWIKALYSKAGANWYIPVGEAPRQAVQERLSALQSYGNAIQLNYYTSRYYYDGGVAPHAIGYVQSIPKEELNDYLRKGYSLDEKVGRSGLEKWGQDYLAGQRGASLYLTDPNGVLISKLVQVDAKPAQSIYTTLDKNLQLVAQKAIEGFRGAIVVLERDTGRVLSTVSAPGFDPNAFEPTNNNSGPLVTALSNNTNQPLINRAAQTSYPMGSIFKTVTMSAALESGLYTADTTYDCQYTFKESGPVLYDWTYEKGVKPSGVLTLPEGLMRSCNTYFYHIGLDLFRKQGEKAVTDMARGYGLGNPTGIGQVAENPGNMPYPASADEAVQMAIGQGQILASPLQAAVGMAAIGNGGTVYRPQLVEKIVAPDGVASYTFKPEAKGKAPISNANLKILQDAMRRVVADPRGTGNYYMTGLGVPVYGKTGTASNAGGNSHAWFAGYTNNNQPDKPDLAIAVLCENAGEGSEIALPIFRRVVETYFFGRPLALYWWETTYYVTKTPAPASTPKP